MRSGQHVQLSRQETVQRGGVHSGAQVVALVVGLAYLILGAAALGKTGFGSHDVFHPNATVIGLHHTPLLGMLEFGYGVVMLLAAITAATARRLVGLLGVVALAFGVLVLVRVPSFDRWFASRHANGWLFVVTGGIGLLAAIFSPDTRVYRKTVRRAGDGDLEPAAAPLDVVEPPAPRIDERVTRR